MAVQVIEKKIFWERARSSQPPILLALLDFSSSERASSSISGFLGFF